ncbi:FecR family protein [Novosphingobium rosa]|uniref:FecR family protein n=1 Tax=Novosphingobium rosa TaxID=76978 RepID=UPI000836BB97|nr:FecR domain-containing protein [Novosphingobium rosa]
MNRQPSKQTSARATAAEIEQAAADWLARIDRAPLSDEEDAALRQWAQADPRHAGAYARAMAVDLHLDRARALGEDYPAAQDHPASPLRRRLMVASAGAIAASAVGFGSFALLRRGDGADAVTLATAKGATRDVALQEGSRITLNTMTQLRPAITSDLRRIDLLEGEALFDVAKDAARPFIVHVGDLSVRAVGTSFSVRRTGPDAIRLLVTEGVVEVKRKDDVLGQVRAGVDFTVDAAASPVIAMLDAGQMSGAMAWRQGRIDLQGLTLGQAAAEFSRYSDTKITLADASIAGLHISGVYATGDPAGFAHDAALSLGLSCTQHGADLVISRP